MSVQYRVSMDKRSGCDKLGIKLNARQTKKIEEALQNG